MEISIDVLRFMNCMNSYLTFGRDYQHILHDSMTPALFKHRLPRKLKKRVKSNLCFIPDRSMVILNRFRQFVALRDNNTLLITNTPFYE